MYSSQTRWWKIARFGIKSEGTISAFKATSCGRGSTGYRAPEVLLGLDPTNKADIWSLGCILYELCTGKRAFENDILVQNYKSSADLESLLLDGLEQEIKQVIWADWISRMLRVDHRRRPSAAFLSVQFGSLLATIVPNFTDIEVYSWASERYILGSDGPLPSGIIRWRDLFVPGRFEQHHAAFRRYVRILDTRSSLLGDEHPATLWSAAHLIWACLHHRVCLQAEVLLNEINEKAELLQRHAFPDDWTIPYALAWSYTGQERHKDAAESYKNALRIQKKLLGSDHPDTLACQDDLTWSLYDLGQRGNTLQQLENISRKLALLLGSDHSDTLYSINGLGNFYYTMGHCGVAIRWYEKAVEGLKRVLGMGHPHTARSMIRLAQCHCLLNNREYRDYDEILEVAGRLLGPNDSRVLLLTRQLHNLRNNSDQE